MGAESLRVLLVNQASFAAELRALGHTVFTAGWVDAPFDIRYSRLAHVDDILSQVPDGKGIDAVVYFDDSHSVSVRGLESLNIPSLFYTIDVHHHWRWHGWLSSLVDRTLVAQKGYIRVLADSNKSVDPDTLYWFPLWASSYIEPPTEKTKEVCFRGNLDPHVHPERAKFFADLKSYVPIDAAEGPYLEAYPQAKIVVNQCVGDDVNFRVFEALMCGALLVTPKVGNGFSELFEDGKHLLAYKQGDASDAAEKVTRALSNESERLTISSAGRAEVLAKHTAMIRAREFVEHLRALKMSLKPRRHFAAAMIYLHGLENFRPTFDCETVEDRRYRAALVFAMRDSLLAQLQTGEEIDDEFRALLLTCKCYLELVITREELLEFSAEMRRRFPEDLMFNLAYIDDLLATGREAAARSAASELSSAVQEFLASVPVLIGGLRQRVLDPQRDKLTKNS